MTCPKYIAKHCVDRRCGHLDLNGACMILDNKPLECRLFPLDLAMVGDVLFWIMWPVCPNHHLFNKEMMCNIAEAEIRNAPEGWLEKYLSTKNNPLDVMSYVIGPARINRPPSDKENP